MPNYPIFRPLAYERSGDSHKHKSALRLSLVLEHQPKDLPPENARGAYFDVGL